MGAKRGILIRKGEAIQTMKEIKTIMFDKTGTITKGRPEVTEIYGKNKKSILETAANLEQLSTHPIARAIVKKANLKKYKTVKNFKTIRGKGLEGTIGTKKITIGNETLMVDKKIPLTTFKKKIEELEEQGNTIMIVAENKKIMGVIGVADALKEDSIVAIAELNRKGYKRSEERRVGKECRSRWSPEH